MVIQIPLSLSGPPAEFAAKVDAHRAALAAHRVGKPGIGAPQADQLVDSLVERVPQTGPVATRGPDEFRVRAYEIIDDTPAPPAPPTLAERKAALLGELHRTEQATRNAILSPGRANLLTLTANEAMNTPEPVRSPDQATAIAAYVAFQSRSVEITHNAAVAQIEIEDLDEADVASWKVPSL